ncbi:tetratricopeptide repeat protein [Bradyrhizobium sp. BRP22]|uniref:tetratricopeptide repeat protein n=1 Tax=Bradyrhizobium sp. BRP22 TaxID=2793821 RepID=UPI001CD3D39C|nr:tetratricopeptide repeat protein [Bradyrhizobium sp. BRP22]
MALAQHALAASVEPLKDVQADPAPCLAAAGANDDDKVVALCTELIDNENAEKADRAKALVVRGDAYARKDMVDRAISDYDSALGLDPTLADTFNARGELWRRKGDRPKALADFGAAIKLNPDHAAARANYKSLALELERLGALMAVAGKPSFNCARARRTVEKAICANPELADLDREIFAANARVVREAENPRAARALQREQDEFIARRNAQFGRPGYDLHKAMQQRLQKLNGG